MDGPDFWLKTGDTRPALEARLTDGENDAVPLGGATVRFTMEHRFDDVQVAGDAIVTDSTNGRVAYQWVAGDTDVAGHYNGEFVVDHDGGVGDDFLGDETFPNSDYIRIHVRERL